MSSSSSVVDRSACVVIVPVGHVIEPKTEQGLRELERRGYPVWRIYGYAAIDFARSNLATRALAEGYAETLWIDSDIVFHPDDIDTLRMTSVPEQSDLPGILSGIYAKKGTRELTVEFFPKQESIRFGVGGGLVRVQGVPGGMLLVRRWVYEAVEKTHHLPRCQSNQSCGIIPFFLPMVVDEDGVSKYLCEDFAFSHRVRSCGIDLWADTRMRLYHLGSYPYGWEDAGIGTQRYPSFQFELVEPPPPLP
jgi:hypothetical protein